MRQSAPAKSQNHALTPVLPAVRDVARESEATTAAPEPKNTLFNGPDHYFGNIDVHPRGGNGSARPVRIQAKLSVNQPGDSYEREADAVADRVMRMDKPAGSVSVNPASTIQRKESNAGIPVSPATASYVGSLSGGHPLSTGERSFFEPRIGHDLGRVRLHTDNRAAESARGINALAYTNGNNIVFGAGQYRPETESGKRLLAHELVHTVQQEGERSQSIQDNAHNVDSGGLPLIRANSVWRSQLQLVPARAVRLTITIGQNNQAEFVLTRTEGAPLLTSGTASGIDPGFYQVSHQRGRALLVIRAADGSPLPETTQFHYNISDSDSPLHRLLNATSEPIAMEVRTGDVGSSPLVGGDPASPATASTPEQEVGLLPERVRRVLFSSTATHQVQPSDYPILLRIGQKLVELSPSELEAYQARTTSTTSDLSVFEASVDRYLAEVHQRRQLQLEAEQLKQQLFGLDSVYGQYIAYRDTIDNQARDTRMGAMASGVAIDVSFVNHSQIADQEASLTTNLQRYGFSSIAAFEQTIQAFETAFRNEAVLIARDMLDRYEHVLVGQLERYQNIAETTNLHQQLQPARQHYQQANQIREDHSDMPYTPEEAVESDYWQQQFREEQFQGQQAVSGLSSTQPLLADRSMSAETLALTGPDQIQGLMLGYIRDRRSDVATTRRNLTSTPDMIFELPPLLEASYREQHIQPGSIYDHIIQHHISKRHTDQVILSLGLSVLALAAGLLSGGTGTVAVLGAGTALGIGAYQAVEEFQRYERMSAAHGAQLLSDDPSFAWVVVAAISVGIDAAVLASAFRSAQFVSAIRTFNQASDVGALRQELAAVTTLDDRVLQSVIRGAELEVQTRTAWRSIFRPSAVLRAVIIPYAEEFGKLVYAVYLSGRRGILRFEQFVQGEEALGLIGDVARLSPEDLTLLKTAYRQAVTDAGTIARRGQELGLTEEQVHFVLRRWNNRQRGTVEQAIQELETWSTANRIPGASDAEHAVDELLRSEGRQVQFNILEGEQGAGRQGDRFIDGVRTEYKNVSGVSEQASIEQTSDAISKAISSRIMDGRGQATHIIVDVRGQAGMTESIARRAIRRAYGADNPNGGKIQSIRIIGNGFSVIAPRI